MKKNIIIIGPPRSGKTTLAQKIVKELKGYSLISGDNFSASYISACKYCGIRSINIDFPKIQCYHYLTECMYYENKINYVFESSYYNEDLLKQNSNKFLIIFLGYSKLSESELFNNIRKNDKKNDWTYIESDQQLKFYCEEFVKASKEKEQIAKDNNYWYIDTSYNRDTILNEALMKIKSIINNK